MKTNVKNEAYKSEILDKLLADVNPVELKRTRNKMLLAARIDDGIIAKGWSKTRFAREMHKNPSEISKWMSGTHNFTTETLWDIEEILGIELVSLKQEKDVQLVEKKEVSVSVTTNGNEKYQPMVYCNFLTGNKPSYFVAEI